MAAERAFRLLPFAAAAVFGATLAAGCGKQSDRLLVTGEVTFDGRPVEDGFVTLIPLGKGPSAGGRITAGQLEIAPAKGPLPGEYRILVQATRETGRVVATDPAIPNHREAEIEQYLPARYNSRSELTARLSPDHTHLDLDLVSD